MPVTRSAERTQFLIDTLTTALAGGIDYWATIVNYDAAANTAQIVEDEYIGTPDEKVYDVTIDTIAHGWSLYQGETFQGREYSQEAMRANRTNGDEGDVDADVADNVLQLGMFDKIVYG